MKRGWMFGCALFLVACGGTVPDTSEPVATGGKADDTTGAETIEYVCSYDLEGPADTSGGLEERSTGEVYYRPSDAAEIDDQVALRQIVDAVTRLTWADDTLLLDEAFDSVDQGDIYRLELQLDDGSAEWIRFYLGDTEVGMVYEAGTVTPIAEIGDGDVMGCGPTGGEPEPVAELTCDWDIEFAGGIEDSGTLGESVAKEQSFTIDDVDAIDELTSRQIFKALDHTSAIVGDEDFDIVFDAVDEGIIDHLQVEIDGVGFDWVRYYAGDTEVGVVFDAGSLDIVAEVGDGDILGCVEE